MLSKTYRLDKVKGYSSVLFKPKVELSADEGHRISKTKASKIQNLRLIQSDRLFLAKSYPRKIFWIGYAVV